MVGLKQQECRRGSCVVVVVVSTVCVRVGCGGPDFLLFFLLSLVRIHFYILPSSAQLLLLLLARPDYSQQKHEHLLSSFLFETKTKHNRPAFFGLFHYPPRQFLLFSTIQENSVAAQEWPRTGAKIATVRYDNSDIAAASAYGKMTMVRALPIYPLPYLSPPHPSNPIDIYLIKPVFGAPAKTEQLLARARVSHIFRCVLVESLNCPAGSS